jgi:hypothetical protein
MVASTMSRPGAGGGLHSPIAQRGDEFPPECRSSPDLLCRNFTPQGVLCVVDSATVGQADATGAQAKPPWPPTKPRSR